MDKISHKKLHWENVFTTKDTTKVSWYQAGETTSQSLIERYTQPSDAIIDIGCGDSKLLDGLADSGYTQLTGLDISSHALARITQRLGTEVQVIESDITEFRPQQRYNLWHDRAVLHFLTSDTDIHAYVHILSQSLTNKGIAIIATFADDKIRTCSDLPTKGYSQEKIMDTFGEHFTLLESFAQEHHTPGGDVQLFHYAVLKRNT